MNEKTIQIDGIALNHAREMTFHASGLRIKNFNFFLVIMGVLVAAFIKLNQSNNQSNTAWVISFLGVIVSIAFWLLDIRGKEVLDAANAELLDREEALWISIHKNIFKKSKRRCLRKAVSYTYVFRGLYFIGFGIWLLLLIFKVYCQV